MDVYPYRDKLYNHIITKEDKITQMILTQIAHAAAKNKIAS
jgi:hypothetical protein